MPHTPPPSKPIIGVCTLDQGNPIVANYLEGILEEARLTGYRVNVLTMAEADAGNLIDPYRRPPLMASTDLSGLIFIHRWPAAVMSAVAQRLPCVALVHEPPTHDIGLVTMDHASGMHLLLEHLHDLGHRRIGYFGKNTELTWAKERVQAYNAYLDERQNVHDVRCSIALSTSCMQTGEGSWDGALDQALTRSRSGFTAWVCPNGRTAHRLRAHLAQHGITIPHSISLAVFDAVTAPDSDFTRLDIDHHHLGTLALRQVLERIQSPNRKASVTVVPCGFHAGNTTGVKA
jgi:DNA-binding LacI/PurR family transcriptional regulator